MIHVTCQCIMTHQNDKFSDQIKLVMLGTKCDSNEPSVIQICNLDNVNRWCIALYWTVKSINADWGIVFYQQKDKKDSLLDVGIF